MKAGIEPVTAFRWPDALVAPVRNLPEHSRIRVALSGGLDSVLLLHLAVFCHHARVHVDAIHVNHQLQHNADETEAFCRDICGALKIPLVVSRVTVNAGGGAGTAGGVEEAARKARYQVFENLLEPGDLLLMAHHADDQAETVLFRLLRGSGVAGLAGMPRSRSLGKGRLVRPLLDLERSELALWAGRAGLSWVEDPSNSDRRYDRNFLRHGIIPELKSRWSGLTRRIRHSAESCAESEFLNRVLAEKQYQQCSTPEGNLAVAGLRSLSLPEQKNLLFWWIRQQGFQPPSAAAMPQVLQDLLQAGEDRHPELSGQGYCLQRFRGQICLIPDARGNIPEGPVRLVPGTLVEWGRWRLCLEPAGANPKMSFPEIRISTRQGGERLRVHPNGPSKSLKKWFQEQGVPPWERSSIPLVFAGSEGDRELIAVADLWCSSHYTGAAPATGWRLIVRRDFD